MPSFAVVDRLFPAGLTVLSQTTTVPAGEVWELDPYSSVTVQVTGGSLVVLGTLRSHPVDASVVHLIQFPGVDESAFVGGGTVVLSESDRGLWLDGAGRLDLVGTERTPWLRAAGGLSAGATSVVLESPPVGWRAGDELAVTPTQLPNVASHWTHYDYPTVVSVVGSTVTFTPALTYPHPMETFPDASTLGAEVLNLTRNVRIEGTVGHRTHLTMFSTVPQTMSYVGFRHMGPRQLTGEGAITKGVLGRYATHFHHTYDGSRGSVMTGLVDRDSGGHSFVPHESHGTTWTQCIGHNNFDEMFWYDLPPDTFTPQAPSDDTVFDRCVASLVKVDPASRGFLLNGFQLGNGVGNRCVGCVAVGVQGSSSKDSSGFHWPEGAGIGSGLWEFDLCVSHNNVRHGLHTWQNGAEEHVITRFTAYHNGGGGISHGAYVNGYQYGNSMLVGNQLGGLVLHANAHDVSVPPLAFDGLDIDAQGMSPYAVNVQKHTLQMSTRTKVRNCTFAGYTTAAVGFTYVGNNGATTSDLIDFEDCAEDGSKPRVAIVGATTPGQLEPGSLVRWIVGGVTVQQWTA